MESKIRYARNGEVHIAYRVFGAGPRDIILVPGTVSHVELFWELPANEYLLKRLSSFARVIVFDKRGQGLSDRVAEQTMEERVDDLRAVMDAVGSWRATVYGWSEGGQMSLMYAALHPERISSLVLYGAFASTKSQPWCVSPVKFELFLSSLTKHWGEGILVKYNAPSRIRDEAFVQWFGRLERAVASPGSIQTLLRANYEYDIIPHLSSISVPTLIMHRRGDALIPIEVGRYLAWNIPGARYYELPGDDHLLQAFDLDVLDFLIDRIEEFATGSPPRRVLAETLDATLETDRNSRTADIPGTGKSDSFAVGRANAQDDASERAAAVFRREGEYWTVSWHGNLVRLKDAKGFHYLKYLLANAGRQVPASELATLGKTAHAARSGLETERATMSLGDHGPMFDTNARASYRSRIEELQEELAEADALNDSGRAALLRWELEQLGDQLAAAVGLRGRVRTTGSHRERARLMVTKAIKVAIAKVNGGNAALGHHLATCVKTGNFCAYDPGPQGLFWQL
jgi:pimeloyl-ACP methyl ester carboxylesterase